MPSLKDVKMKIVGVGKTKQITRAMNMVASAKLRGAQARIEKFRPYAAKYREVVGALALKAEGATHPLLENHAERKNCAIILITSDRGLCGGFNSAIIAEAFALAKRSEEAGMKVDFTCIGRKGRDAAMLKGYEVSRAFPDRMSRVDMMLAIEVVEPLIAKYKRHELDEVWVVYGEMLSMAHQPPKSLDILPVKPPSGENADEILSEYVFEPGEGRMLAEILPRYVNAQVYRALLDTSASEHAARMAAMDNATRNCNDLINSLTLLYNKTRQASITSELIDIVGGAEALK